jgi:hypothetical protein
MLSQGRSPHLEKVVFNMAPLRFLSRSCAWSDTRDAHLSVPTGRVCSSSVRYLQSSQDQEHSEPLCTEKKTEAREGVQLTHNKPHHSGTRDQETKSRTVHPTGCG